MKNTFSLFLSIIILSISTISYGQHEEYFERPAIYSIDAIEKSNNITPDFYTAWENGSINVNDKVAKNYQYVLENDFIAFTINGWLYALSLEPVSNCHNDTDYLHISGNRNVWLYMKNTKMDGDWSKAVYNPVLTSSTFGNEASFHSKRNKKVAYSDMLVKSKAYKNVVFILYEEQLIGRNGQENFNYMLILTPVYSREDDLLHFSIFKTFDINKYPLKFTGTENGGKTLLTIDNYGKPSKIITYFGGKDANGRVLSNTEVSYDGDYGWKL